MQIADLLINLGFTGGAKVEKALTGATKQMDALRLKSLATKIAIMGAVYAFERMLTSSADKANDLKKFSELTGITVGNLQRYQKAAIRAGVASESVMGALKNAQDIGSKMFVNEGGSAALSHVANSVGIDEKKITDAQYLMNQFQKFVQKSDRITGNTVMERLGFDADTIVAMRRGAYTQGNLGKQEVMSDDQINNLSRLKQRLDGAKEKFSSFMGGVTEKFGDEFVNTLEKVLLIVEKLVTAFLKVGDALGIFKAIEAIMKGIEIVVMSVVNALGLFAQYVDDKSKGKGGTVSENAKDLMKSGWEKAVKGSEAVLKQVNTPFMNTSIGGGAMGINQTFNSNITAYGVKDAKELPRLIKDDKTKDYNRAGNGLGSKKQGR